MGWIEARTEANTRLHMTVAINYGGRNEILRAAQALAARAAAGEIASGAISEEDLAAELDTGTLPDPDLVIRTSGETRISNFLLWQSAYAEYEFTPTLWPDFTPEELAQILDKFGARERRFGGVVTA
jgi:undecaprenyl diphosphate synthase